MIQVSDIHSLTGFLRDHKAHLDRLASTGRPEILTVNGRARVVVQDAEAYQKLMVDLEEVRTEQAIREGLASIERGEPGIPAEQVLADIRARLGIKKR